MRARDLFNLLNARRISTLYASKLISRRLQIELCLLIFVSSNVSQAHQNFEPCEKSINSDGKSLAKRLRPRDGLIERVEIQRLACGKVESPRHREFKKRDCEAVMIQPKFCGTLTVEH